MPSSAARPRAASIAWSLRSMPVTTRRAAPTRACRGRSGTAGAAGSCRARRRVPRPRAGAATGPGLEAVDVVERATSVDVGPVVPVGLVGATDLVRDRARVRHDVDSIAHRRTRPIVSPLSPVVVVSPTAYTAVAFSSLRNAVTVSSSSASSRTVANTLMGVANVLTLIMMGPFVAVVGVPARRCVRRVPPVFRARDRS